MAYGKQSEAVNILILLTAGNTLFIQLLHVTANIWK